MEYRGENGSVTLTEAAIAATLAAALLLAVADVRSFAYKADHYDRCVAQADDAALVMPDFGRGKCP
jgi:hypothetical protein